MTGRTEAVPCPHLEYRTESGEHSFDHERPYCELAESFVQPMRADICANRHGLDHERHCEIYRDHHGGSP